MSATTKITGLSGLQVRAINDAVAEVGLEGITTTATTATFSGTPAAAEAAVRRAKDALAALYGGRGHPVQSLHAVIRKFAAMPGPSVPTDAERAEAIAEAKRADQRAVNLKAEMDRIAASTGVLVIREAYQDMPTHVVLCPSRSDVPVILAKLIPGATMSGMDQYDEADGPGGFADWFMAAPVN